MFTYIRESLLVTTLLVWWKYIKREAEIPVSMRVEYFIDATTKLVFILLDERGTDPDPTS
jgi:hypothetical protein